MSTIIDTLITNRSQADIEVFNTLLTKINTYGWDSLLQTEKDAWFIMKATYKATDYNRVGMAMIYIKDKLATYGYHYELSPVVSWLFSDVQTVQDNSTYLVQLNAVKTWFYNTAQALPTNILSLDDANKIEALLVDMDAWLNNMIASILYLGTFYSGEEGL